MLFILLYTKNEGIALVKYKAVKKNISPRWIRTINLAVTPWQCNPITGYLLQRSVLSHEKILTFVMVCSLLPVTILLLAISEDLPRNLVFPVSPLLHRPVEGYCPGAGTLIDTTTAVPALIGMQYYRWFAFLGVRYKYVYLADFNTGVASVAYIGVENYRISRADNIG
jgi:surface polysaccharide O-acyltransferase-like enzyme